MAVSFPNIQSSLRDMPHTFGDYTANWFSHLGHIGQKSLLQHRCANSSSTALSHDDFALMGLQLPPHAYYHMMLVLHNTL
ncbi:hypothetical protein A0H81_01128 [Grifola frondosa]|uniref:Uncharacterized protein n=1 Tax=Grifola frondosa TaxID=5627 RepID=A0A1C7MRG3_GRIFR|nr:hypothetical protein A0H81_01128 [Grifola frondosa]